MAAKVDEVMQTLSIFDPARRPYEPPEGDMGWTPLHWASVFGHKRVVKLLLGKGAEPDKGLFTYDVH